MEILLIFHCVFYFEVFQLYDQFLPAIWLTTLTLSRGVSNTQRKKMISGDVKGSVTIRGVGMFMRFLKKGYKV